MRTISKIQTNLKSKNTNIQDILNFVLGMQCLFVSCILFLENFSVARLFPKYAMIPVMPSLSVIIPTHNRADILQQCLEHLAVQTIKNELEIIVVSDGHDAKTAQLFDKSKNSQVIYTLPDIPVQFFEIPKSHQGIARNVGVQKATSSYSLFIGDDIFLMPDACERHLRTQQELETKSLDAKHVVLGYTTWDPVLEITRLMRWLERSGWQFGYGRISPFAHERLPETVQHLYTYSSHVSLPTELALTFPFREDVSLYGWEDIEWGIRLRKGGVRVFYEPDAKAYHHHPIIMSESIKRMETIGESAVQMRKLVPGFDRVPQGPKLLAYRLASLLPTVAGAHRRAFLRGMRKVQRGNE